MTKQVSIIFLVKDPPIDRLAALVEYMRPVADQFVIVVDDRTSNEDVATILTWEGTKVVMFEWCDDFAAARNAALPHVKNPWTLHLDPDELPSFEAMKFIGNVTQSTSGPLAYIFWFVNWWGGVKGPKMPYHWHIRLWQSGHGKFYRSVHELVELDGQPETMTRRTPVAELAPMTAYIIHSKSADRLGPDQALYEKLGERSL